MSIRAWISVATALLLGIIIVSSRHELAVAWGLLQQVDLRILALLLPVQFLSYFASGAVIFSYLKQKGALNANPFEVARMSLELNFVNHILPSGGVSGASYMTWRLGKVGVTPGRATMAQAVRFVSVFLTYVVLLLVALVIITLDGNINRLTLLVTSGMATGIILTTLFLVYIIGSQARLESFSKALVRNANRFGRGVLRSKKPLLEQAKVTHFFAEMHQDYVELRGEPRILIRPVLWGTLFNICEVALFCITFWALGTPVNPAPLLIAIGVASIVGSLLVTPGGAGGYEVLMIAFLAGAGISPGVTVAAILLTRTLLILLTILSGYLFYQMALNKYGKAKVA